MELLKNKWFWAAAFGLLFAMSIDVWAFDWTGPTVLGLPYIIWYTTLLEGALFVLLVLFARYYWTEDGGAA
jgi:hypothetical protein